MTVIKRSILSLVALTALSSPAHAHFKMLQPASWLNEDSVGGPQKGSPCGPGGTGPLGDDVSPVPESKKVTEVKAGDTVMVEIQETIFHPGYFRIALAENRSDLKIPPVDDPNSCALDLSKVPTEPHDNVLADGLWQESSMGGSNRHLMQEVKLPNKPCENCTLQVIQVMKDHGLSSCYYYHCANLKIVAADGAPTTGAAGASAAGTSGSAGATASSGTGGASSPAAGSGTGGTGATAGTGGAATNTPVVAATGGSAATAGASASTTSKPATTATTTKTAAAGTSGATTTTPPKSSGSAGTSSSATSSTSSPATAESTPAAAADDGGCQAAHGGPFGLFGPALFGLAAVALRRRRSNRVA